MQITVISGSHRQNSQSEKVARHICHELEVAGIHSHLLSLAGNPLPLWDQGVWEGTPEWQGHLGPIREQLRASDGFVVISPEWHGQVPAGLKNFFLLAGREELGHKPALIVTVSAGGGGAFPIAELRMSSYKNSRLCYIPEQVVVRDVAKVLNHDPAENDPPMDSFYRERIAWSLEVLRRYASALAEVRADGVVFSEKFRNGMG